MCNSYRITPKHGAVKGVAGRVAEVVEKLPSSLVRKSDPGIVMRAGGQVVIMRWGFCRNFNPSINNARSDKLEGGMWAEAFRERRCVIPMSLFYEWGPGVGGRKQAHEFRDPDDDYLWVAGIWEDGGGDIGPCYSMVTTAAPPVMAPIHHRMPAVLRVEETEEWLSGEKSWLFLPFAGPLTVTPCVSPLVKPKADDTQQELF